MSDTDEFYDVVSEDYEWKCPGKQFCEKLKESRIKATLFDKDTGENIAKIKRCIGCNELVIIPITNIVKLDMKIGSKQSCS